MTRGLPKAGDVVFTTEGPMGEVIQLTEETAKYALGQRIVTMRGKKGILDNAFLRYLLTTPHQQAVLASYATGTTVLGISQAALRSVPISFPKWEEQLEIAEVLTALDDKIELNQRMNETLEALAQAIFKDWFVTFGPTRRKMEGEADPVAILGGLIPDPTKATPLAALFPGSFGEDGLPEGWEEGALGVLAESVGSVVQPASIAPSTPYIGLEHMPRQSIALGEWGTADSVTSAKAAFTKGQILFGKLRPYFHKVGLAPVDGVASTDIVVLDAKDTNDRALIATVASTESFVNYTDLGSDGTKMPRTSWAKMKAYPISIADRPVLDAFNDIVQPLHDKIVSSIGENRALAETRNYLLPKLMSGAVRVRDAAAMIEGADA